MLESNRVGPRITLEQQMSRNPVFKNRQLPLNLFTPKGRQVRATDFAEKDFDEAKHLFLVDIVRASESVVGWDDSLSLADQYVRIVRNPETNPIQLACYTPGGNICRLTGVSVGERFVDRYFKRSPLVDEIRGRDFSSFPSAQWIKDALTHRTIFSGTHLEWSGGEFDGRFVPVGQEALPLPPQFGAFRKIELRGFSCYRGCKVRVNKQLISDLKLAALLIAHNPALYLDYHNLNVPEQLGNKVRLEDGTVSTMAVYRPKHFFDYAALARELAVKCATDNLSTVDLQQFLSRAEALSSGSYNFLTSWLELNPAGAKLFIERANGGKDISFTVELLGFGRTEQFSYLFRRDHLRHWALQVPSLFSGRH